MLTRVPGTSMVFVVTTNTCRTSFCLGLFRTTSDGGFDARTAPPVKAVKGNPAGSLDQIAFANERTGFAVVGENTFALYATTNGARSWHRVATMPGNRWFNLVVTPTELLVTTETCKGGGASCGDYMVWRSSLAGSRWTELPQLFKTGNGNGEAYYGPSVAASGDVVWEQESTPRAVYLWISHNDGRTFTRFTTPRLGSVAGCDITASSPLSIWAECPTGMEVSFSHSDDNGIRWTPVLQHEYGGTGGGGFAPVSGTVAYLDYGDISTSANLYRLTDGGRRATSVGDLKCSDVSLVFTSVENGVAVCVRNATKWELVRTTDGGARWSNEVLYGN